MTQQEIKDGMTQGEWTDLFDNSEWVAVGNQGICSFPAAYPHSAANAAAICSAVNNTYNIGVNPEKVGEMAKEIPFLLNLFKGVFITFQKFQMAQEGMQYNEQTLESLWTIYKIENNITLTESIIEEAKLK